MEQLSTLYAEIPILKRKQAEAILSKIRAGQVSELERIQYDKYVFLCYVEGPLAEMIYNTIWIQEEKRIYIGQLRMEKLKVCPTLGRSARENLHYAVQVVKRGMIISELCKQLDISNTGNEVTIPRERVEQMTIQPNTEQIMGLEDDKSNESVNSFGRKLSRLRRVFGCWSGGKFELENNVVGNIKFVPVILGIWDAIRN